jgi:hypothetical protein
MMASDCHVVNDGNVLCYLDQPDGERCAAQLHAASWKRPLASTMRPLPTQCR